MPNNGATRNGKNRRRPVKPASSTVETTEYFDGPRKSRLRRNLLNWFGKQQRQLPWRKNPTRYRIWISEIMLQQTQVATVIEYYRRFLQVFPTIKRLAEADEQDVLRIWEGLGYYRRARQMHAAAKIIVDRHAGRFPDDFSSLIRLPGIGRYTAGAILSIADNQPWPILEGNSQRLLARLLNWTGEIQSSESQSRLWRFSEEILSQGRPGEFNQALMELGALICRPARPACHRCPLKNMCLANLHQTQDLLPVKRSNIRWESVREAVIFIQQNKKILLRKGADQGRWAGMWDFPRYRIESNAPQIELERLFQLDFGSPIELCKLDFEISHTVTRFRIRLECYQPKCNQFDDRKNARGEFRWHSVNKLESIAFNVTARKIANRLLNTGS